MAKTSNTTAAVQSAQLLRGMAAKFRGNSGSAAMARGAVGVFAINVAGTALNVGLQVWLARLLGVDEFGIYIYVLTWLNLLLIVGVMGMDSAALRFVAAYRGTDEMGRFWGFLSFAGARAKLLSLAVSFALALGIWVLREKLGAHKALVFWLGCLLLPMNILIAFNGAVLQALKCVVQSQSLQYLVRLSTMFSLLAAVHFLLHRQIDALSAMVMNGLSAFLTLAGLRWLVKRELPPHVIAVSSPRSRREWSSVSRSLFAISGCQLLLSQVDILLVGIFTDTTQAGLYAAASRIAALVTFGITSINSVLAPTISELFARNERVELQSAVTFAARVVLIYTVPVVLALILAGRWVLGWFGPEFVAAYPVLVVLATGQVVIAVCGSVGFLLTMTGHQREAFRAIAGSAVLTLLLNLTFIPFFGLIGAAVATMTATAARSVMLSFLVRRRLQVRATAFGL